MSKQREKFRLIKDLLNPYVLIVIMIVIAALATYVIPAGLYDYVVSEINGKTVVDPTSFHLVAQSPVGLMQLFSSVSQGLINNAQIIFFVFIIAGAFEVLNSTGFTTSLVGMAIKKCAGKEKLIFPIIIIVLSILAGTIGMAEEVIVFIPIIMTLCKSMGYDELVAMGLAYCGIRAGHINGLMNPFNVGIAQSYAELPMYSGLAYRVFWCVITIAVTAYFINRYATKIKADPTKSLMYGTDLEHELADPDEMGEITTTHKILGLLLLSTFGLVIYGVYQYKWYLDELAAVFLAFGILAGIIGGLTPARLANTFIQGAKNILGGALIVGVAGGILVILKEGQIVDSIIYYCTNMLSEMPKLLAVNGMYMFQWLLNLVIPSGSAQAATTMPIMVPISDILGINRQIAVTAFHYGDGVTNLLTPACGPLMAALAVAKVPFDKWLKWVVPILISWTLIGFAAVTVSQLINYGPF